MQLARLGGVGANRVLVRSEDVGIAQADALQSASAGEDVRVKFVDIFGDGVG